MPAGPEDRLDEHSRYAGVVSRLSALALDIGLLTLAGLAVSVLPGLAWQQVTDREPPGWLSVGSSAIAGVLPLTYFAASWWLTGQTAGNLLLGIVVRHRDGGPVSLPQALLRAFFGRLLPIVWLVGMLAIVWDRRRRAWHDRVFRTVVCYGSAQRRPPR